ncbi:hypothetical protein [Candidatus Poriferisocius sp.]|uniref:hypothetical protein n=1 Tax=Candidatus Poriferisocius sp. TaxID=3101276 RepID=UPI003B011D09
MNDAVLSTLIGVLGTGLIGMFYIQLQNLRADMKQGFRDQGESIKALEAAVGRIETDHGQRLARIETDHGQRLARIETDHGQRLARIETDHGQRLARIEAKLDDDPPTQAA